MITVSRGPAAPGRAAALLGAAALLLTGACSSGTATGGGPAADGTVTGGTASSGTSSSGTVLPSPGVGAVAGIAVTVADGEVRGPGDRVEVPLGAAVRVTVTSDEADEVHVHGYDRTLALRPGIPASVEFPADIPGVFEVELHESGLLLTRLQVQ